MQKVHGAPIVVFDSAAHFAVLKCYWDTSSPFLARMNEGSGHLVLLVFVWRVCDTTNYLEPLHCVTSYLVIRMNVF